MMYVTRMIALFKTIKRELRVACDTRLAQLRENQAWISEKLFLVETKTLQLWCQPPVQPRRTTATRHFCSRERH